MQNETAVVVLAAGKGTRMRSTRPKMLHRICGVPMLGHVQRVARAFEASRLIVVVGREADEVREAFGGEAEFVLQAEQLGTGHAVMMAQPKLSDFSGDVLVLYGDTPLLRVETLERMRVLKQQSGAELVMLTASGDIPGRVVRDAQGRVERIVEAQDASEAELAIEERNTGVYLVSAPLLWEGLAQIGPHNRQGELYITDVVGYAVRHGRAVEALWLEDADECLGINTLEELAVATTKMRARINLGHMAQGVTLIDPERTYIDAGVAIGPDTVIEPGCTITAGSEIGRGVHIKAGCYIEESRLDDGVIFGPMSHLRPNCHLMSGVKIGNFVEVKNSTLGQGTKAAHLTYIGDADVGAGVNFGCGSIVVNHDGRRKHRTVIGDSAYVGCNVNLIAPIEIEPRGFLAAGSTITQRVPADALGVARARQRNLEGWVARRDGRPVAGAGSASSGEAPPDERGAGAAAPAARRSATGAKASRQTSAARRKKATARKKSGVRKKAARKKKAAVRKKKSTARKKAAGKQKAAKRKGASRKKAAARRAATVRSSARRAAKKKSARKSGVRRKSARR